MVRLDLTFSLDVSKIQIRYRYDLSFTSHNQWFTLTLITYAKYALYSITYSTQYHLFCVVNSNAIYWL